MSTQDKTRKIQQDVDEVTIVMQQNISKVVQNTDNLEDLTDKSAAMKESANQFKKGAVTMKREAWWRNMKLNIIIGAIIVGVLVVIILAIVLSLKK